MLMNVVNEDGESIESDEQRESTYVDTAKNHLKYVVPFIPANSLMTAGTLVTGKLLADSGEKVITALPYIYSFYSLTQSASTLFIGTGVNVANARGRGDIAKINTILKQSMLITGGLAIPFLAILYQGGNISRLIGAPNAVATVVQTHLNQYGWGVPLIFINVGLSQVTIPFSTVPSSVNLITNTVVNCGLSFLFTNGAGFIPPMPIAGTALAFSVTNALNDIGFFIYMLSQARYRQIIRNNTDGSHLHSFKNIMNVGLPISLNTFSQMASNLVATTVISALLDETALQQQGLTIVPISFLQTIIALNGDAAAVLISNQVGARSYSIINKYVNTAHAFGVLSSVVGSALIAGLAGPYVRYFADPAITTPEFVSTTQNLLLLSSFNQILSSIGVTSTGALRGIDENWKPLLINLGLKFALNLLGSTLLMYSTNLGVYSPCISDLIISSLFYTPSLYYYCKRKITSFTNLAVENNIELVESDFTNRSEIPLDSTQDTHQTFSNSFFGWLYPRAKSPTPNVPFDEIDVTRDDQQSKSSKWFCF